MRRVALAALLVPLVACSGGSDKADAGKPDAGDPVKVFGLDVGDCYEFSSTDMAATPPSLGVAVEGTNPSGIWYLPDGGSATVTALNLVYRQTGTVEMTDTLYVADRAVLLLKRDVAGAETTEFRPAVPLARLPLKNADHLEQDGGYVSYFPDGSQDGGAWQYTFDVAEQTVATPSNSAGFDAFQYTYSGGPTRLSSIAFAPGTGPVELAVQFAADSSIPVYKLQGARMIPAGDQTCGGSAQ